MFLSSGKKNEASAQTVPFYTYPIDTVRRSILLVTNALTSLRGAAKCLSIFSDVCPDTVPSHTTIQNWILQYGLNELMKPVQKRDDWIFILDHTIEFGQQKCLVILGITQEELLRTKGAVIHEQLRTLTLDISNKTNSKRVYDALNTLMVKTGIPTQIVSDHGSDLKKGVEQVCREHPDTRFTYDITHKCGLLVKHALSRDITWSRFLDNYSCTKRKCVHSRFAFLAPRKLRDKSRWMNLDVCVDWAKKITAFQKNMPKNLEALNIEKKDFGRDFEKLFGWTNGFSQEIDRWSDILEIVSIARDVVKANGLVPDTPGQFSVRVEHLTLSSALSPVSQVLIKQLHDFLFEETKGIAPGEKFLGSSDIIESVFAKYKNFSARTPMKGVGKTVLTIPAILSRVNTDTVADALRRCPKKEVSRWLDTHVGTSIFSQRAKAFAN